MSEISPSNFGVSFSDTDMPDQCVIFRLTQQGTYLPNLQAPILF